MNRYYSGVMPSDKWNREDVKLSGRKFLVETHDDIGVTVGVDTAITESWQAVTRTKQAGAASAAIITIEFNGKIFTVFPDGIVVALDDRWKENRMMRDPSLRRDD